MMVIGFALWLLSVLSGVAALVCGVIGPVRKSRKTGDHRRYARWARRLGGAVMLIQVIGVTSGLVHTYGALDAQGLSASDKQRILSNGTAEAFYSLMFAIVVGGPGVVLGLLGRAK